MEKTTKFLSRQGAPLAAVLFFVLWCVGEAGRMHGGFGVWASAAPLVLVTLAIGVATWSAGLSTALILLLVFGQLAQVIPAPTANGWAIFLGAYIALGFIMLSAAVRWRKISAVGIGLATVVMTYLMLSPSYGAGVGWVGFEGSDEVYMLVTFAPLILAILAFAGIGCAAAGLLLAMNAEKRSLAAGADAAHQRLEKAEVQLAVEHERNRIARDLHDVLAHSLAVIAAQSDGARYENKSLPASTVQSLETIADAARTALIDAQGVIENMSESPDLPQPTLAQLHQLLEDFSRSGLQIQPTVSGVGSEHIFSPGQQLAVYRIVQESLTNALKYADRERAVQVHLEISEPGLSLHITSRLGTENSQRAGRGIPGMHERAALAGGWLTAGAEEEHFRVTAFIPGARTVAS